MFLKDKLNKSTAVQTINGSSSFVNNDVSLDAGAPATIQERISTSNAFGEIDLDIVSPGLRHVAFVLLLDTSSSMSGEPIRQLNNGLRSLLNYDFDNVEKGVIDIAIVAFNSGTDVVTDFQPIGKVKQLPTLEASGGTDMYAGLLRAYDLIKHRIKLYSDSGVPIFVPWIYMITDGCPNNEEDCIRFVKEKESKRRFFLYGIGTTGYNLDFMKRLCVDGSLFEVDYTAFDELFKWISKSISDVSKSKPDETTDITPESSRIIARK